LADQSEERIHVGGWCITHWLRVMWYSLSLVAEVFHFLPLKRFRKGRRNDNIICFVISIDVSYLVNAIDAIIAKK
jgi:hypothetical protein